MKKIILAALVAIIFAGSAVQAQKINKESLLGKLAKSDAEIADAKKAAKVATWLNRGKVYFEAASEPTKNLFVGMDPQMMKISCGEPLSTGEVTVNNKPYTALEYNYFTVYVKDNKIVAWKQKQEVKEGAVDVAIDAYNKALELDSKSKEKVRDGLKLVSDYCAQIGNIGIDLATYKVSSDAYITAYRAQSSPAYEHADSSLLYYAGYLSTVNGSNDPKSFVEGADYLNRALQAGYKDEDGNIYYYLFHCYYGQKATDPAFVLKAKEALLKGNEIFPKNDRILDGLMQLYTTEKGVGDPAELVTKIDKAIENDPKNVDLWFGRGRIYYAMKNFDESIASFQKVVELKPDMFEGNYYLGVFYTLKGDAVNGEMNAKQYSSQAAYDADLKAVNGIYGAAIPWFEKAFEIKPTDPDTLEFLKSLCFRMRDEEGMMPKYEKYNAAFKKVKGIE